MTSTVLIILGIIFVSEYTTSSLHVSRDSWDSSQGQLRRERRSPRTRDDTSKYGELDQSKYEDRPFTSRRSHGSVGDEDLPLVEARAFDTLGGGMIPLVDERSAEVPPSEKKYLPRPQERAFDTLGGGEIPWIKRKSH